jgi:hypothetical protein
VCVCVLRGACTSMMKVSLCCCASVQALAQHPSTPRLEDAGQEAVACEAMGRSATTAMGYCCMQCPVVPAGSKNGSTTAVWPWQGR